MLLTLVLIVAALALAWANGANDTGKPVASLVASGALRPAVAMRWAAAAGFAGSVAAVALGADLARLFAGSGIVDGTTRGLAVFTPAVAGGAALAVMLASRMGLPISTTHALLGALVGTALVLHGSVAWATVGTKFALPLLLSPVIALILSLCTGAIARYQGRAGACLCTVQATTPMGPTLPVLVADTPAVCAAAGATPVVTTAGAGQWLHLGSGLTIAAARGLNDTPKIAALLLPVAVLSPLPGATMGLCGAAIALGGWLAGQRVLRTMATRLVRLEGRERECGAANLSAALVILAASPAGLPVSTTHVTTGAMVGAGALAGGLSWRWLGGILLAWVTTLPLAAGAAALLAWTLAPR
jgi:PiT family inorganic phosphate transporter